MGHYNTRIKVRRKKAAIIAAKNVNNTTCHREINWKANKSWIHYVNGVLVSEADPSYKQVVTHVVKPAIPRASKRAIEAAKNAYKKPFKASKQNLRYNESKAVVIDDSGKKKTVTVKHKMPSYAIHALTHVEYLRGVAKRRFEKWKRNNPRPEQDNSNLALNYDKIAADKFSKIVTDVMNIHKRKKVTLKVYKLNKLRQKKTDYKSVA